MHKYFGILAAAVAAGCLAASAQAALYDLTYTMTLTSPVDTLDGQETRPYPEDWSEIFVLQLKVDDDGSCWVDKAAPSDGWCNDAGLDPLTGAVSITMSGYEGMSWLDLNEGTGTWLISTIYDPLEGIDHHRKYQISRYTVEGLPDPAPVPLPAALPLMLVGLGTLGFLRHRRR